MSVLTGSDSVDRQRFLTVRQSRLIAAGLGVSIPLWWIGLRAWAESTFGYLEVDAIGISPFAWIAAVAVSAGLLAISPPRPVRAIGLGFLALAGAGLGIYNLAVGLGDGAISTAGWGLALLSFAQLATIAACAALPSKH